MIMISVVWYGLFVISDQYISEICIDLFHISAVKCNMLN